MVPQMWMAERRISVCLPGRQRKWAITCVGNRGRHRFGQKPSRHPVGWFEGLRDFPFEFFAGGPGFAKERDHFPIECQDVIQFATISNDVGRVKVLGVVFS